MGWYDGNKKQQLIKERGYTMADAALRFWKNSVQFNSAAKDVFNLSYLLYVDVYVAGNALLFKFRYDEGEHSYLVHHGTHATLQVCCSSFTSRQAEALRCWHDVDEAMDVDYGAIAYFDEALDLDGVDLSGETMECDGYTFRQIVKQKKVVTFKPKAKFCHPRIRFNKAALDMIDTLSFNENFYVFIERDKVVLQFTPEWDRSTWTITRDGKQNSGLFTCTQLMKIRNFRDGDFHVRKSNDAPNAIEILLDQPF